jgi:transcriptional regulator with XRE-family HTH domain
MSRYFLNNLKKTLISKRTKAPSSQNEELSDNQKIEIGKRIKALRKEKELTQARFAVRIRRDTSTVSKIESGELELSNLVRLAICNIFGVREEWLLTGKEPQYDDRLKLLEERAKELGKDTWILFIMMKNAFNIRREAHEGLFEKKPRIILHHDEAHDPKFFELLRQFDRIYMEGAKSKISAIESMFEALDPGEKKQNPDTQPDVEIKDDNL